eukprot:447117-Pyramimonas_sp.AAC.2
MTVHLGVDCCLGPLPIRRALRTPLSARAHCSSGSSSVSRSRWSRGAAASHSGRKRTGLRLVTSSGTPLVTSSVTSSVVTFGHVLGHVLDHVLGHVLGHVLSSHLRSRPRLRPRSRPQSHPRS